MPTRADLEATRRMLVARARAAPEDGTSRDRRRAALARLRADLRAWLGEPSADDATELDGATPVLLFPVRIETRFDVDASPPLLRVRVYPDAISVDGHEPALAPDEVEAGHAYWETAWTDEEQAWRDLTALYPLPRSAYIAHALEPTNLSARPDGEPVFPEVPTREAAWTRAPTAPLLPDRWTVYALRSGRVVRTATTEVVSEPLAVGPDPEAGDDEVDASGLDDELRWIAGFEEAVSRGMAVSMSLSAEDVARGFDELLVLGVKASLDDGAAAISRLLEAHRYGPGLAFVGQGAATNNTEEAPSSYPPPDAASALFQVERRRRELDDGSDGAAFAAALGLDRDAVQRVLGADHEEQQAAAAMNRALWPIALGYFLRHVMHPHFSDSAVAATRQYFVERVKARGPMPAFRIGSTPYTILPVTDIAAWQPLSDSETPVAIVDLLRRLRPAWNQAALEVPRVGRSDDPDRDLLELLSIAASSRHMYVRTALGPDLQEEASRFLGEDGREWERVRASLTRPVLARLGVPSWRPRLLDLVFADESGRFRYPMVDRVLSETEPLEPNYITWLLNASATELRSGEPPGGSPNTLLFRVLRHAALRQLADSADEFLVVRELRARESLVEAEIVGLATEEVERPWDRLERAVVVGEQEGRLADLLINGSVDLPGRATMREFQEALSELEELPTAELDRLFGETMDACSHRLDAWLTSVATARLERLRREQPDGIQVGAYGWLEGVRPAQARQRSHGYVHAPSLDHAATAAVLRNGFESRGGAQDSALALDLSSRRVRGALAVLDAMGAGASLGAVLGYRLERGLRERHVEYGLGEVIALLRRRFPLARDEDLDEAQRQSVVVDGLAVRSAWKAGVLSPATLLSDAGVDAPGAVQALTRLLEDLDTDLDGVADLLTAESCFQLVRGNTSAARAALDVAKGDRARFTPEVIDAPSGGSPVTHRVAVVWGASHEAPEDPWSTRETPRATAHPELDRWAAAILGDPSRVRCRARVSAADGSEAHEVVLSLADLDVRPIDILAMTALNADPPAELRWRLERRAKIVAGVEGQVDLDFSRAPDWSRRDVVLVPELLAVASFAARIVADSRPLRARDLGADAASSSEPIPAALADRAGTVLTAMRAVLTAMDASPDPGDVQVLLDAAADFGVVPPPGDGDIGAVRSEMERRLRTAEAGDPSAALAVLLGVPLPFLPAVATENDLMTGRPEGADPDAIQTWLRGACRQRTPLLSWRQLRLTRRALGSERADVDVVQAPQREGARWAALATDDGTSPPPGAESTVLWSPAMPAAGEPWVGLVLDEWTELIPAPDASTAATFHFDTPGSQAPNALLLAVPPAPMETWSSMALLGCVRQALELARIRAVLPGQLGDLAHVLPTTYLAASAADDTVSTDFAGSLVSEVSARRE